MGSGCLLSLCLVEVFERLQTGHKTYGILAYISYSVSFASFPLFASKFGWPVNLPLIEDNQAISGISFLAATEASADRGQMWTPVCSVEVSRAGSDAFACRVPTAVLLTNGKPFFGTCTYPDVQVEEGIHWLSKKRRRAFGNGRGTSFKLLRML
jgi:hypothetical protein